MLLYYLYFSGLDGDRASGAGYGGEENCGGGKPLLQRGLHGPRRTQDHALPCGRRHVRSGMMAATRRELGAH